MSNMKIIFVGVFSPGRFGERSDDERVARALERADVEIVRCDARSGGFEGLVDAHRPDWVVFNKLQGWTSERVRRTREIAAGVGLAQILFDLMDYADNRVRGVPWLRRSRLSWWLPVAREMDIVFLRERGNLKRYALEGVRGYYLDQAADAEESPSTNAPATLRCDVAFFGSYLPSRGRMLRRLAAGRRLRVYSACRRKWIMHGVPASGAAYGSRLAEAVAAAGVVYGESARSDIDGYWSDRVYRILGHRGFFLTKYVPGLETIFTNHRHLVWGHDDDELVDLCSPYLADPVRRCKIAEAGFQHVRAHHTYDHRAREIIGVLERLRGMRW